jgi:hypothetical protein
MLTIYRPCSSGFARRAVRVAGHWPVDVVRSLASRLERRSALRPFLLTLLARVCYVVSAWRVRSADQRGSQITDNLGLVVIGIVAIVAIGGLVSGLDKAVFNWVTGQLGLSGTASTGG